MKKEFEIPDKLIAEMKKYPKVNWDDMMCQAIDGFLNDFTILDRLKDFWGIERKK